MSQMKTKSSVGCSSSASGYLDSNLDDELFPGLKGTGGVLNSFGYGSLESQLEAKRKEKATKAAQERKTKSYFESITSTLASFW
jgi:hypothetical protein